MKITFTNKRDQKADLIAVLIGDKGLLSTAAKEFDKASGGMISAAIKASEFEGKSGQMLDVLAPKKVDTSRIILVGVGSPAKLTLRSVEDIGGRIVARGKAAKGKGVHVFADLLKGCEVDGADLASHLAYGALLKSYTFNQYFTTGDKAKKPTLTKMVVVSDETRKARAGFSTLDKIAQGVFLTRDLVSEPSNVIYPESLAKKCRELQKLGVKVDVLTERRLQDLGMNALLGVGQGSARESRVVVMEWNGVSTAKGRKASQGPVAIVGKGVTFDTGGISLKPPGGMEMMKWDMGGSATVIGLMKALAGREAKAHVVGIVGLVENMPSGTAQRPGDVVKSMSGQTIEVINTDAEGRLVLADVLHYTQKRFKPRLMVDLATLTGAIITSLGNEYAGMFSNNDDLCDQDQQQRVKGGKKHNDPSRRCRFGD